MGEWQLPYMHAEWDVIMKDTDRVQLDMAELLGVFYHTEQTLIKDVEKAQAALAAARAAATGLTNEKDLEIHRHTTGCSSLQSQAVTHNHEKDVIEANLPEVNNSVDKLKSQMNDVRAKHSEAHKVYGATDDKIKALRKQLANLKADIDASAQRMSQMRAMLVSDETKIDQLKNARSKVGCQLAHDSNKKSLKELQEIMDQRKAAIKMKQQNDAANLAELEHLKKLNQEWQQRVDASCCASC